MADTDENKTLDGAGEGQPGTARKRPSRRAARGRAKATGAPAEKGEGNAAAQEAASTGAASATGARRGRRGIDIKKDTGIENTPDKSQETASQTANIGIKKNTGNKKRTVKAKAVAKETGPTEAEPSPPEDRRNAVKPDAEPKEAAKSQSRRRARGGKRHAAKKGIEKNTGNRNIPDDAPPAPQSEPPAPLPDPVHEEPTRDDEPLLPGDTPGDYALTETDLAALDSEDIPCSVGRVIEAAVSEAAQLEGDVPAPSRRRSHRGGRRRRRSSSPHEQHEAHETQSRPEIRKEIRKEAAAPLPASRPPRRGRRGNLYPSDDFSSVEMMSSLKGFAPMGMLFVLMDVLRGHEEGLIHVNQLAQALGIGKPSLSAQLENLEAAGLIRTVSSSQAGRHVELLTPNMLRRAAVDVFPSSASGALLAPGAGAETGGQFSQRRLDRLRRYLEDHGVEIVSVPDEGDLPANISQMASFLGKYIAYVQPFYDTLKTTLNSGKAFQFSLAKQPGRTVTHTLNFCRMLRSAGFLTSFSYQRTPQHSIVARVNRVPAAINFLTGGWLEHYVRDRVISILTTHPATIGLPYAFLKNPGVILPGGENFELDFLLCVGEKIFWIEAKTGEYMTFLPKYSRVSKLLGLGRTTSMVVSVESLASDDNLTARYNLSCCNLDEFPDVFRINLVRELHQEAVQRILS